MHIYADEWGNTGKDIFAAPDMYYSGAILAAQPIDDFVGPVLSRFMTDLGVSEIHASHLARGFSPGKVAEIADALITAIDDGTRWSLHVTAIHKPYLATTKFVDTIFDSGENLGVRPQWYLHQYFRHAICCVIDDMLTPLNRKRFWFGYIGGNREELKGSVRNALTYLDQYAKDKRLREVVRDALQFAVRHPEQFAIPRTRRDYRGETPNLVAFGNIMGGDAAKELIRLPL